MPLAFPGADQGPVLHTKVLKHINDVLTLGERNEVCRVVALNIDAKPAGKS